MKPTFQKSSNENEESDKIRGYLLKNGCFEWYFKYLRYPRNPHAADGCGTELQKASDPSIEAGSQAAKCVKKIFGQ